MYIESLIIMVDAPKPLPWAYLVLLVLGQPVTTFSAQCPSLNTQSVLVHLPTERFSVVPTGSTGAVLMAWAVHLVCLP